MSTRGLRLLLAAGLQVALTSLISLRTTTTRTNSMVQQLYESIKASKPEKDVRILLVGLVFSLEDIDSDVTKTLQQLCSLYNEVEMHLVYAKSSNSVTMNQMRLEKAGCHVTLVDQENLLLHSQHHPGEEFETNSRFQKLALLRSLQRLEIIQWQQYRTDGLVVIVDLDITAPPPLYSLMHAIHRVNGKKHTIACANGYETWYTPWGKMRLYYDTLASIDRNGKWWYRAYAANIWQIITFGQARLLERLLSNRRQRSGCNLALEVLLFTIILPGQHGNVIILIQ